MHWDFPVTGSTSYEVRLYFAEMFADAQGPGLRKFDVSIEGSVVLNDYDIFADVGGYTGVMKRFVVDSPADDDISILFGHVVQNPGIKAIEIVAVGDTTNGDPVVTAVGDQSSVEG